MDQYTSKKRVSCGTDSIPSVVIPTKNAGEVFEKILNRIRAQKKYGDAEIVVIDSASTDSTVEISRFYNARILSIAAASFNHGHTRNFGISHTTGDPIFLFTQDAMPTDENYFERMIDSMKREGAAGVYARQMPRDDASLLVRRDYQHWSGASNERRVIDLTSRNEFLALSPIERYYRCGFDNVASLIRRGVWEKIPFSRTSFGEDIDWAYRALLNGYTIVYEPEATVIHSHERSARYQYQRTFVDHYKLHELFSLRTVPSKRLAWRSFALTTIRDWAFLMKTPRFSPSWLKGILNVPRYAWASAWGQYDGARAAAGGFPSIDSYEV